MDITPRSLLYYFHDKIKRPWKREKMVYPEGAAKATAMPLGYLPRGLDRMLFFYPEE